MTDADAFLANIIADPDADAPRLVYADWLDDRGDGDRAEFIRVQCGLAKVDENNRDIHPLASRERELLEKHQQEWLRPLRDLAYPEGRGWLGRWRTKVVFAAVFRRGFPESVVLPCGRFLQRGEDLFRAAPIQEVQVDCVDPDAPADWFDQLTRFPPLGRLTTLRLRRITLSAGDLGRLAAAPHLDRLRELHVDALALKGDDLTALAESPLLPRLRRLKLEGSGRADVGVAELAALVDSPASKQLTALGLCGGIIASGEHLQRVLGSPQLERVTDLDLSENLIRGHIAGALPQMRPALRRFVLRGTALADPDATALSRWPRARNLLALDLRHNAIGDTGALALADSPFLLAPTRLRLHGNPISDPVKRALRIRFGDGLQI
ncbi:MAG TPA: TIGR02996 domain-containing protein [Gemmataceae bacterium]|jgi:uncharacterized protein (TIGR02996 family)|nr:TIGR02996 domain-containing protein [Gemmataceae bacterium]